MTFTQWLLSAIAVLTIGIAGHGVRLGLTQQRQVALSMLDDFTGGFEAPPLERLAGAVVVISLLLCIGSAVFVAAWRESHPDRHTAYGLAYEECVTQKHLNRWLVDRVRTCVADVRAS